MHHQIASRGFACYLSRSRDDLNDHLPWTWEEWGWGTQMISCGQSPCFRENQEAVLTPSSPRAAPPTSLGSSLATAMFAQSYHVSGKQSKVLILRPICAGVWGLHCQSSGEGAKQKGKVKCKGEEMEETLDAWWEQHKREENQQSQHKWMSRGQRWPGFVHSKGLQTRVLEPRKHNSLLDSLMVISFFFKGCVC